MRIYLAGPMTGLPEYNFPAFYAAAAALRALGHEVWSPAENDVALDGFDPAIDRAQSYRHYMKRDLPAVLDADAVACLPDWERSKGARLEVHVARECGIPVLDAESLEAIAYEPDEYVLHDALPPDCVGIGRADLALLLDVAEQPAAGWPDALAAIQRLRTFAQTEVVR